MIFHRSLVKIDFGDRAEEIEGNPGYLAIMFQTRDHEIGCWKDWEGLTMSWWFCRRMIEVVHIERIEFSMNQNRDEKKESDRWSVLRESRISWERNKKFSLRRSNGGFKSVGRDSVERVGQWPDVNELAWTKHIGEMKCNAKIEGTSNQGIQTFSVDQNNQQIESKSYDIQWSQIGSEEKRRRSLKIDKRELSSDSKRKREWSERDIATRIKRFDKCAVLINYEGPILHCCLSGAYLSDWESWEEFRSPQGSWGRWDR